MPTILPFAHRFVERRIVRDLQTIEATNPDRAALVARIVHTIALAETRATSHPPIKVPGRRVRMRAAR